MATKMLRLLIATIICCIATSADACNRCGISGAGCHVAFARQQFAVQHAVKHVVQKQVVAVPQHVYYFVGAPLRAEAVIEHQKQRDPDYQQFQQFKEFLQYQRQAQEQAAEQPQEQAAATVLQSKCASCHNAKNDAGGFALDGSVALDSQAKEAVMASVLSGDMPKGQAPLTPEELGELVDTLFLNR